MELTVLGSGTALPQAHRAPTGIWLKTAQVSMLVDCGAGTSQRLVTAGGSLRTLDAILLSHAHLDHLGDLPSMLFSMAMPTVGRKSALDIVHSRALTPYLDGLRRTFGDWMAPEEFPIRWHPLDPGQGWRRGALQVTTFEVAHHATSIGFRVRSPDGVSVAIPGDTSLCQPLIEGVTGADCLVIECSAPDDRPVPKHMTPSDVIYLAQQASPSTVVITHQYPEAEEANVVSQIRIAVEAELVEAVDGLRLRLAGGQPVAERQRVETTSTRRDASPDDDPEALRRVMEAELAKMDANTVFRKKFGPPNPARKGARKDGGIFHKKRWTAADLRQLNTSKRQKALVKRAVQAEPLPELNLRGSRRDPAFKSLVASVETWRREGKRLARVVTGKGKHSDGEPVVKLMVMNWLETAEGKGHVSEWAPQITADGDFGSVVLALKKH